MKESIYEFLGKDLTRVYRVEKYSEYRAHPNEIRNAFENDLRKARNTYFLLHPSLAYGDYYGYAQHQSNVRIFLKRYKNNNHVRIVRGDFGYEAIAIDILCRDPQILEELKWLADNAAISSDDVSKLEMELEEEAWKCHIKGDLIHAIEKKFAIDDLEMSDDALWELYRDLLERSNTYVIINEGCTVYVDIKRLIAYLDELPTAA